MEWREQSAVSCNEAYLEAQRWLEAVTKKKFGSTDFRSALENGVLLCDLINKIKPGIIKRVNRLSTPIAGLDNLNVFLKACGKLGLKEAQLFHPGDLQDLSTRVTVKRQETNRRLKNVLITIYWLGRRAHCDPVYDGPYLNLKAFEGLLGTALSKALEESSSQKGSNVRDSGFGDSWYSEREELFQLRGGGVGGGEHRRDDSLDSLDSLGSRPHSISSDTTLKGSSEGCCSDTEADSVFRMAENKDSLHYRRSLVITPKTTTQFNQFLPSKDKPSGYVPAPLRKKRAERHEDNRRSWASPMYTEEDGTFTSETRLSSDSPDNGRVSQSSLPAAHLQWAYEYESGSDSDPDRPDPDLILDDLAGRRFHSPSPAPPTNFAVPISPVVGGRVSGGRRGSWPKVTITPSAPPQQNVTSLSSSNSGAMRSPRQGYVRVDHRRPLSADSLFREMYDDSEDEDDEEGYADPIQDDLYARKVGLTAQSAVPYDKFLPKFWTPEEDLHIQKIKLGSQRRPWYKKMQGFSLKKLGSSSDDSDCDINPWLSSAPSPSGPSLSHSHTPEASAHTTLVVGKRSIQLHDCDEAGMFPHIQLHTTPQLPKLQAPQLVIPPLVFAPVDPTSGPRLVKCEKRPLLGRQDPLEPPDPFDYESIIPDLENDDMFARRTQAFQSNTDLVMMKTQLSAKSASRRLYASESELNIVTQPLGLGSKERTQFPDIERDDVVYRKVNAQQAQLQRPLSGAPDNYAPMPIPAPWALPPNLQARLLCPPSPLTQEAAAKKQVEDEMHPTTDDMLVRKLRVCSSQGQGLLRGQSANHMPPSMPPSCSEDDLQKWQAIREASQLRYKKRLMVERSKSMSDIQVDPAVVRQVRYEELQRYREQVTESDDKWQDDLTKWKNRRKSVNSDIVKKKEEREQIEQITHSGSSRRSKTFKEMQEERSYTIDTPYSQSDHFPAPSVPSLREEDPPTASPATGRAASPPTSEKVDIVDSDTTAGHPTTTYTSHSATHVPHSPPAASMERNTNPAQEHPSTAKPEETSTTVSSSSSLQKAPEPRRPLAGTQTEAKAPYSGSSYKQPQYNSMEPKPPGVSRVSASLPRSYQRSDSERLTSVVTPRPFGTQSTRVTSLPRPFTMDDSHKRVNGDVDVSKKLSVPSRYHQFMTSEDEARSHSSSAHSSENEEEEEETKKSATPTQSILPVTGQVKSEAAVSPAPTKNINQENYCDMRISLNQRPNSSQDFGFQADWDSTGAHVTSIQPGSPAEMCQLQVTDEVLTVSGHRVAGMSYTDWKACMEEALQQGSLVMDIRRHGKNNWDRDLPSLPFKSHKTINLTTTDHPILLGVPDENAVNASLDFTSRKSTETLTTKEVPTHPIIDVASNGVNGGFREEPVTMRNKESEPISLKNLKRRSEFFEQGGSESAISDIPVPAITPSSTRWSWDPEEERRRQEKWQKEQERLLQEKYKRDQEKLEEEWRKAQQEIANSTNQQEQPRSLEVNNHSISPHSPLSPLSQPSPPWEDQQEEERKRREEQERQRQAEERRKWEEEEQELQRLQEERKRREKQEEEERKRREEEELNWQRRREEEREEGRRRQEAAEQQRRERERAAEQQQQQQQQQWAKSKSTPQLDEAEKPESKGVYGRLGGMAHWLLEEQLSYERDKQAQSQRAASELEMERRNILNAMKYRDPERVAGSGAGEASWRDSQRKGQQPSSLAEQERQQILQEMKKKTPLLTDNSWIRQRSTTTAPSKEPVCLPMRRGESLDNLDIPRNSWRSSWTPGTTSSIPNYSRPHSALSGSTSFYGGGVGARPSSATLPSSYSMGSLRGGAGTPSSPWSQQPSPSPSSPSPTTSPEPTPETRPPHQSSRSVSGKKICTYCDSALGKGAAMIIESLGLCYHLGCFKCIGCKSDLGGSEAGAEVRIRNKQLFCNSCYMRLKAGQPTSM
ncbi:LIM domain only protein 7 [Diretmus argenteus]